jgi:hypothetical protein
MGWFLKIGARLSREDFSVKVWIAPLTAHPENAHPKLTDRCVQVPGQIFGDTREIKVSSPDGFASKGLLLFTDIVVTLVIEYNGAFIRAMQESQTNLEGLPSSLA